MEASGKKSEIRLTDEERFRLIDIFAQSPISIELYDKKGILVDVNRACVNLFGLSSVEDVKGINLFDNPHLTEQTIIDLHSGKSVRYELAFDFDLIKKKKLYRTSREGVCFLECFINPTINENNEISGYIVHVNEITERKKAEEKLIRSEEIFRRIVEASTRGMYFYKL
ncbi:MAG: PAS domain S-box protein, partial [Prolixibacteraceae bacterium]|nr:PAS domain S-box protein [Prolixibacteraceae bacterium]